MKCPKCGSTNVDGQEDDGTTPCSYLICRRCYHIEINRHDERDETEALADWQTDPDFWKK